MKFDPREQPIDHNFGKDVDTFLQARDQARVVLQESMSNLLETGAKVFMGGTVIGLKGMTADLYHACNNQEFSWEAEYKDGTIVKQFDNGVQHHFGDIDQGKLKMFRWMSLFNVETSNADKRVIVTLDFETGLWSFYNAFLTQEMRAVLLPPINAGDKPKLIMKMVKRQSVTVAMTTMNPNGEVVLFTRYIIGWEVGATKVLLCIEPNGLVHLWHD